MSDNTSQGGLRRPQRQADDELARAAAKTQQARDEAERKRAAAQAAREEAQRLSNEADQQEADAAWNEKEAQLAAVDRENARKANELMARASSTTTESRSTRKIKSTTHPLWVIRSRPRYNGLRRLMWWFWVNLRLYKMRWIPQPRVHGTHYGRVIEMSEWLMEKRHAIQAIIISVVTKGGATKTTNSTWRSAVRARLIKLAVIIVDTDSGGGKVLKRFRLDAPTALTTITLVERGGNISYEELTRITATDPATGVIAVHSPPGAEFEGDALGLAIVQLHKASHTLVVDCGPGFKKPNTDSVVKYGDVIEIPADFRSDDSLDDVKETLDHAAYGLRHPDVQSRVLVVVSAVRWRHFNYRTQYELAKRYNLDPDQIVLLPYNRYFLRTGPVNLDKLRPKQNYAYTLLDFRAGQIVEKHGRRTLPVIKNSASSASPSRLDTVEPGPTQTAPVSSASLESQTHGSSQTGWSPNPSRVKSIATTGDGSSTGLVRA